MGFLQIIASHLLYMIVFTQIKTKQAAAPGTKCVEAGSQKRK